MLGLGKKTHGNNEVVSRAVTVEDAEINEPVADIMPAVNAENYTANTRDWKRFIFTLVFQGKLFLSPVEAGRCIRRDLQTVRWTDIKEIIPVSAC